ncbi:MAG: hypothetical protein PVG53_11645 [Holophagae bacterium]
MNDGLLTDPVLRATGFQIHLQESTTRALGIETPHGTHLQVGVLTGIPAINAELELGVPKADSRFLQEAIPACNASATPVGRAPRNHST